MVGGGTSAGWDSYHIVLSLPYRRGRTLMPPAKNLSITATIAKRHDGEKKTSIIFHHGRCVQRRMFGLMLCSARAPRSGGEVVAIMYSHAPCSMLAATYLRYI